MAETAKDLIYLAKTYTNFSGIELPEVGQQSQTFAFPLLRFGTSSAPVHIKTASTPVMAIYSTTTLTGSSVEPFYVKSTIAGAGAVGGRSRFHTYANVAAGGWINAIKGYMEFGVAGRTTGLASAVCAELLMPNATLASGVYAPLEVEYVAGGTSTATAGALTGVHAALIYLNSSGDADGDFDDNGFFFCVDGLTAGAANVLGAASQTLRIGVGTSTRYLMLSQYEDTLSIGLTGGKKTLVTGVPEIAVWSTSSLTSGTQDVVKIDYTQAVAQTSGYVKGIRATMTADVATPGSCNAIKGIIDYSTNGYAYGDAAPLASELTMPNSTAPRGAYYGIEAQISAGASSNFHSAAGPVAFAHFKALGTVLEFETYGYLFHLDGIGAATAGEIFDTCTAAAASHALRILIGTTPYYIMLNSNVDA